MEIFPFKVAVGPNGPQQYLLGLSEFFRQLLDTTDPPTSPSNEAPHIQAVSHHISNQWATTSPPMNHNIYFYEPQHLLLWATTYLSMSHHISTNEPQHLHQWATTSLSISHNISVNEPQHLLLWATTSSPRIHQKSSNEPPHIHHTPPYLRQ